MMKAGTETGSLINHLMSRSASPEPQPGMGATILCWTDRFAGTILKVTPTTVTVQRDTATRIDRNGMTESQEYAYGPNPKGLIEIYRKTKTGWKSRAGYRLTIGIRNAYHDYSF